MGAIATLNVNLNSTGPVPPAALQWTIAYLPAGISSATIVPGPAAIAAGKTIACNPSSGGLKCVLYGLNTTTVPNGVVATVQVVVAGILPGPIVLNLNDVVAATPNGDAITPAATSGTVNVTQPVSTVPVTLRTNPEGLGLIVDGASYISPQTFQWIPGSTHSIGVASLPASAGTRYSFANWSDGGAQTHAIVAPSSDTTFTANLLTSYLLTTSAAAGGAIQVSPPSPDGYYAGGTLVQLAVNPGAGFRFDSWAGDLSGAASPAVIFMNGPKSVTASFLASLACSYSLSRSGFSAFSEGDAGAVDVFTTQGCTWTATSNSSWVVITSASSREVRFSVLPNATFDRRTANITIGTQSLTIEQAGGGCSSGVMLSARSSLPAAGGPLGLAISAPPGCQWSAVSSAPAWLNQTLPLAGTGASTAPFSATPNTTPAPRTASVSVGGSIWPLIQPGAAPVQHFIDVPPGHLFADHISLLRLHGVTNGCSLTDYCPDAPTVRWQMAVFIIRALLGTENFAFPPAPYFTDVPPTHEFFKHIQKLRELNITLGCSTTQYCPDDVVTRSQMAAFLIRARLQLQAGQSFPYPSIDYFRDVPSTHHFFSFVQKLRQLGITIGCTDSEFCPESPTTRGQMAAFLIRAFFTP